MGVRPLHGLVSITACATRSEADAAVALLGQAGIDALVLEGSAVGPAAAGLAEPPYSVLVRIAIADDAQQVLVRGGRPPGPAGGPSPLRHPSLLPRLDDEVDLRDPEPTAGADPEPEPGGPDRLRRPAWVRAVAWVMVVSVLLPLLLSALRAIGQL